MCTYNSSELQIHKKETLELLGWESENPVALNHMAVFLSSEVNSIQSRQKLMHYLKKSESLNSDDIFSKATQAYILATTGDFRDVAKEFLENLPNANLLTKSISLSYDLVYARALIDIGLSNEAIK